MSIFQTAAALLIAAAAALLPQQPAQAQEGDSVSRPGGTLPAAPPPPDTPSGSATQGLGSPTLVDPPAASNAPSTATADYPISRATPRSRVFEAATPEGDKTGRQIPRSDGVR
jgi:hypothetical protein